MQQRKELSAIVIEALGNRITKILPAQIRECLEGLSEDQLWWRPNEHSNSVGNLVLHISGSLRDRLSRRVGGIECERDRSAEFAEHGPVSKQELLRTFNDAVDQAAEVLERFDTSRLMEATSEPAYTPTLFNQIFVVATHTTEHTGQIVYITKMLNGSLDELWRRVSRA